MDIFFDFLLLNNRLFHWLDICEFDEYIPDLAIVKVVFQKFLTWFRI